MNADIKRSFVVKVEQSHTGFYAGLFVNGGNMAFQSPSGNIQFFRNHLNAILRIDQTVKHFALSFRERKQFREFPQPFFLINHIGGICNELLHKSFLLKGVYDRHDADCHKQNQHKNNNCKITVRR